LGCVGSNFDFEEIEQPLGTKEVVATNSSRKRKQTKENPSLDTKVLKVEHVQKGSQNLETYFINRVKIAME